MSDVHFQVFGQATFINVHYRDSPKRYSDLPRRALEFHRTSVELFVFEISENRLPAVNDNGEYKI